MKIFLMTLRRFCDVKKHRLRLVSNQIINKSLFFFQNKARILIVYSLFVLLLFHFTLIILKLEHALITADLVRAD